uniref:Uncharacterized protein n=1 Tax=Romanomermis culicivorax TaxID=13658 RepID=A0A915I8Z0_ROMCU
MAIKPVATTAAPNRNAIRTTDPTLDQDCRGPQSGKRLKEYQCKPCHQIPHQNSNHGITTMTILNAPQAMTDSALLSINPQVFGARLTNPKRTTLKIVFGSNGKMLSE